MTTQLVVFICKLNDWNTIHVSNFKFVFQLQDSFNFFYFFSFLVNMRNHRKGKPPKVPPTATKFEVEDGKMAVTYDIWEIWNMVIAADVQYDDIRVFFFFFFFLNDAKTIPNHIIFYSIFLRDKFWEVKKKL